MDEFLSNGNNILIVLPKNAGSPETKGVTKFLLQKQETKTTAAYGVQVTSHKSTFVIAT